MNLYDFSTEQLIILGALIVLILALFIMFVRIRAKLSFEKNLLNKVMECCENKNDINSAIGCIFTIVSSKFKANEYAFYSLNGKNTQFILKSIHYKNDTNDNLNLSYSGLIPHRKQRYTFAPSLNISEFTQDVGQIKNDKTNVLYLSLCDGQAMLLFNVDFEFKLSEKVKKHLKEIASSLKIAVMNIITKEQLNNKIKILETTQQATRNITNIISGEGILEMAINMFTKTINAKGGFYIKQKGNELELEVDAGFSKEIHVMFKYDKSLQEFLFNFIGDKKIASINSNDNNFSNIPVYLVAEGLKQIILFKINYSDNVGVIGFWYNKPYEVDDYQAYSLLLMFSKISDIFGNIKQIAKKPDDYVEALKLISTLVDDLSPYTVGFSKLMEHYATVIATEMKLSQEEINDIALAAFLSNIGIAALSYDIFLEKRKYSEYEYEIIKLHSEVGADIILSLHGNKKIADMVRYHHERIDGCGYPEGISGDEIPLGAKILAVTQFFIAKISPRTFRDASTFDEALMALKNVAGTQLDGQVVSVFINYIDNLRQENKKNDSALDCCSKMRFVSDDLCSKCPVKNNKDTKCWESPSNLCIAHGNKCDTCFIYTEYVGRKKLKQR